MPTPKIKEITAKGILTLIAAKSKGGKELKNNSIFDLLFVKNPREF